MWQTSKLKNRADGRIAIVYPIIIDDWKLVSYFSLRLGWRSGTFFLNLYYMSFSIYLYLECIFNNKTHIKLFVFSFPCDVSDSNFRPSISEQCGVVGVVDYPILNDKLLLSTIFSPVVFHICPELVLIMQNAGKFYCFLISSDVSVNIETLH